MDWNGTRQTISTARCGAYLRHAGDPSLYHFFFIDRCSVGFGIALFLTELARGWLKRPLGIAIELLAAITVSCFWHVGAVYLSRRCLRRTSGAGRQYSFQHSVCRRAVLRPGVLVASAFLAAGVILAIMIIPYIAAVMRDVFEQTPVMMKSRLRYRLYHGKLSTARSALPFTKNGVIGGIMLGLGRALGETMAVTFIIGNTYQLDGASLYMPGNSITSRW